MNRENAANVAARPDLALATISEQSPAVARRLTEAEEDQMAAERIAGRLARFNGKQGKHGPLATCKRQMLLRIPQNSYLAIEQLSNEIGPRPTVLATELIIIAARCQPENWHNALQAFAQAVKG
jgi:hypothetical protein